MGTGFRRISWLYKPHGFFVGTFRDRSDLYEIVSTIIICSPDMAKQAKSDLINRVLPPAQPAP